MRPAGLSASQHHTGPPLLTSDEVRALPAQHALLFLACLRPIAATKLADYADPEFRGLFHPNRT